MSALELSNRFAELYAKGDFETIYGELYSPDIVSIESGSDQKEYRGMAEIQGKNEWWESNFEVHGMEHMGPYPNGDEFCMIYKMDVTHKESGNRMAFEEVAHYTVANGKIAREKFFYTGKM